MTAKQFAIRLKAEGGAETVTMVKRVEEAVEHGADASAAANARAQSAAQRHAQALEVLERNATRLGKTLMQARIEAMAGGSTRTQLQDQFVPPQRSALSGAQRALALYGADDRLNRRAAYLKAQLDPAAAALDRLNDELREHDLLLKAGKLTTDQHSRAQALAKAQYDQTTLAIDRQSRGLTRLAMASRLNLTRQAADVFTTAAMGMNPGMIAIQQGPQIIDAWGTSAIKVTPLMIGFGAAIAVTTGAAVTAAAAYVAAEAGFNRLDRAATGMGRTAGLTADQLQALAIEGASAAEISKSAGEKLAAQYVLTGRIGEQVLTGLIAVTKDWAAFSGKTLADAGSDLAQMMMAPDRAARELHRAFGLLDQKNLDLIDSHMKAGDQAAAQKILLDALTRAAGEHAEKVGEIEAAWDAAGRKMSNFWHDLGTWLHTTEGEKLGKLEAHIARLENQLESGRGTLAQRHELARNLETSLGERNAILSRRAAAAEAAETARRNQADQLEADAKGGGRSGGDRAAREALARQRREEDRQLGYDRQIAQALGDGHRLKEIERETALLARQRELIDGGADAEAARTQAIRERAPLEEALATASQRDWVAYGRRLDAQSALALGDHRAAQNIQDRIDLDARVLELAGQGFDMATARAEAEAIQNDILRDRSVLMARQLEMIQRAHQLELARARGDWRSSDRLEREDWIARRAREIEARPNSPLNHGEGVAEATRQWAELWQAEAEGARRRWFDGLLTDLRRGGVGGVLERQMEHAADRFQEQLVDNLSEIDWAKLLGSRLADYVSRLFGRDYLGGGGSGLGELAVSGAGRAVAGLIPGLGRIPGNADGTSNWRGGLTWLGERGPELGWLPPGSEVASHGRSLDLARRLAQPQAPVLGPVHLTVKNMGSEPVSARLSQTADGGLELELEPIFRKVLPRVAGDPGVRSAFAQAGKVKRR